MTHQLPGSLVVKQDGVVCSLCGEPIEVDENCIKVMYGRIRESDSDLNGLLHDPDVSSEDIHETVKLPAASTIGVGGVYHVECFDNTEIVKYSVVE